MTSGPRRGLSTVAMATDASRLTVLVTGAGGRTGNYNSIIVSELSRMLEKGPSFFFIICTRKKAYFEILKKLSPDSFIGPFPFFLFARI